MAVIEKIISGGQIGADVAGLRAAARLGIATGGWMPQGFRTLEGSDPGLALLYGLQEHECKGYPPRTRQNVQESDGTVRFARNFNSPGEICTLNAIVEFRKPRLDVQLFPGRSLSYSERSGFRAWLRDYDIRILNVAGNALRDIENEVENFLFRTIASYNEVERNRLSRS